MVFNDTNALHAGSTGKEGNLLQFGQNSLRTNKLIYSLQPSGQIFFKQNVKQKTNKLYLGGIEEIARLGIRAQSIILDGRKGHLIYSRAFPFKCVNFIKSP